MTDECEYAGSIPSPKCPAATERDRLRGLLREAQDVILRKVQSQRIVQDICDRIDAALAADEATDAR
jgi:hypothetical protein